VTKIIIGLDPGLSGAIGVIGPSGYCDVLDIPTIGYTVGGKQRRTYDIPNLSQMLKQFAAQRAMAFVEEQSTRPQQSSTSAKKIGYGEGILHGLLVSFDIGYEVVRPQQWKKEMLDGMGKEKQDSILAAQRIYSMDKDLVRRLTQRHDRAEALLIAEYGRRKTQACD